MKDSENKKLSFLVEDDEQKAGTDAPKYGAQNKAEMLKKPIIFALMGVVFFGCMYLIFRPSANKKKVQNIGLNEAVPQATDAGLESDKQKAYEQALLGQKMQEKRDALTSLSNYWNEGSAANKMTAEPDEGSEDDYPGSRKPANSVPVLNSYRNAQSEISSFYDNDNNATQELRKQVEELKEQLAEKNVPPPTTVQDQLALMEKSYEMASKYLPSGAAQPYKPDTTTLAKKPPKEHFTAFIPAKKNAVSALYREPKDSAFLASWNETRNRGFYTAGVSEQVVQSKNSIRAVVQETMRVTNESNIRLRLLEAAQITNMIIPIGTLLVANAKIDNGRLQLKIRSIEFGGNIIAVDISAYDLDGQPGLYFPYLPEMNAITEIASNMSQTTGTSFMLARSAGQQVAGDLSRGVIQGVSGYLTKKIQTPKITIKAGYQLLLVSKM